MSATPRLEWGRGTPPPAFHAVDEADRTAPGPDAGMELIDLDPVRDHGDVAHAHLLAQVVREVMADADHRVGAREHRARDRLHGPRQLVDVRVAVYGDDERAADEGTHEQRAHAERQRKVQVDQIGGGRQPA